MFSSIVVMGAVAFILSVEHYRKIGQPDPYLFRIYEGKKRGGVGDHVHGGNSNIS